MVLCTGLAPEKIPRLDDAIRFVLDPDITTFASPIASYSKGLSGKKSQRLMRLVKSRLPIDAQGVISDTGRVNAVRGRA